MWEVVDNPAQVAEPLAAGMAAAVATHPVAVNLVTAAAVPPTSVSMVRRSITVSSLPVAAVAAARIPATHTDMAAAYPQPAIAPPTMLLRLQPVRAVASAKAVAPTMATAAAVAAAGTAAAPCHNPLQAVTLKVAAAVAAMSTPHLPHIPQVMP